MSQFTLAGYFKADIAFNRGYNLLKNIYRREIFAHVLQAVALIVFIPIDATLLQTGNNIIAAEGVALGAAILSLFMLLYQYYLIFIKNSLLGYCQTARDTQHITTELIASTKSVETEEDCTSQTVLDAATEVLAEGVEEKVVEVYAKMAKNQINSYVEERYSQLACVIRVQTVNGLVAMLIVVVIMAKSTYINPAEIVVLTCYLVVQALTKLPIILGIFLVAVSPVICILVIFYVCFCAKSEGQGSLDKEAVNALPEDVIKCDGECTICLQDVKPGEEIYNNLPCSEKHIFHKGCLDKWSQVKLTCPTCRKQLPVKNQEGLRPHIHPHVAAA